MYSFPALLVGIVIMMAGQMYAAAIRGIPAGRGNVPKILASTSSHASDPIASIDFYFPFKDLQNQIQLANIECPAPGGSYDQALSLISMNVVSFKRSWQCSNQPMLYTEYANGPGGGS
ncbi:hypothetical protein DFH05DRAFT_1460408 [Lentinula detonsa]|uniref:Uncharacterized protein n=1 Tax=Lentinula detonsa TaxID=2804962 RepID=A0A9W8TXT2_9AGAR|nr:hypothetical protein DFH05DRAFT_1460408 [Lentinula detonsa]